MVQAGATPLSAMAFGTCEIVATRMFARAVGETVPHRAAAVRRNCVARSTAGIGVGASTGVAVIALPGIGVGLRAGHTVTLAAAGIEVRLSGGILIMSQEGHYMTDIPVAQSAVEASGSCAGRWRWRRRQRGVAAVGVAQGTHGGVSRVSWRIRLMKKCVGGYNIPGRRVGGGWRVIVTS